jgi:hypothetical protein
MSEFHREKQLNHKEHNALENSAESKLSAVSYQQKTVLLW